MLRGFSLAASMAASEKVAGARDEYSAGKPLAMILSILGPIARGKERVTPEPIVCGGIG